MPAEQPTAKPRATRTSRGLVLSWPDTGVELLPDAFDAPGSFSVGAEKPRRDIGGAYGFVVVSNGSDVTSARMDAKQARACAKRLVAMARWLEGGVGRAL